MIRKQRRNISKRLWEPWERVETFACHADDGPLLHTSTTFTCWFCPLSVFPKLRSCRCYLTLGLFLLSVLLSFRGRQWSADIYFCYITLTGIFWNSKHDEAGFPQTHRPSSRGLCPWRGKWVQLQLVGMCFFWSEGRDCLCSGADRSRVGISGYHLALEVELG